MKALGWVLFLLAAAVATGEYYYYSSHEAAALAAQAADYDARFSAQKAAADAALKKTADDAAAASQVMQADLDFAKMPEIPVKTQFRPGQVLYVENESDALFTCKLRVTRPVGNVTKEFDFTLGKRAFKDMAAVEDWLFKTGDKLEFVKAGHKPRVLTVP